MDDPVQARAAGVRDGVAPWAPWSWGRGEPGIHPRWVQWKECLEVGASILGPQMPLLACGQP